MATIIDCGNGRYIAGDPVSELVDGHHWCSSCGGSGLGCGWENEIESCPSCGGSGDTVCAGVGCFECVDERRADTRLRSVRLLALSKIIGAAIERTITRKDYSDGARLLLRQNAILDAHERLDWA